MSSTTRPTPWDITTRVASLLGGAKALGMKPRNSFDWVYLIRKGFPFFALDALGRNITATNAELAQMPAISVHALAGRRRKRILSSYESERLFRVARVIARSEDVFDDLANGFAWLIDPKFRWGRSHQCRFLTLKLVPDWLRMFLAGSSTGLLSDNI